MYHVSAQGVDEHMINVHYYYCLSVVLWLDKGDFPPKCAYCASVLK